MNQRLRVAGYIFSGICCVVLLVSLLFLSIGHLVLYFGWAALSIAIVAFSARLVKNGLVETIATLIFACFLFTMILIMGVTDAPFGKFWMIARFIIPFLNVPTWWLIGRSIKEHIDLGFLRQARRTATEINRILEQRIDHKKKMKERLESYIRDKREVLWFIRLLTYAGDGEGGDLLTETFEREEARRATDFMKGLSVLAQQDHDYGKINLTGKDGVDLLRRVNNDIDKCEWQKVNLNLVTSADSTPLAKQLKKLTG
jgi:ABC-type multidrug transport system fused ATPase/permease subunit